MKRTYATIRTMYDNAEIDGDTMDDMMNELDLMNRDGIEIEDDDQAVASTVVTRAVDFSIHNATGDQIAGTNGVVITAETAEAVDVEIRNAAKIAVELAGGSFALIWTEAYNPILGYEHADAEVMAEYQAWPGYQVRGGRRPQLSEAAETFRVALGRWI